MAIILTNAYQIHWSIYAALGGIELTHYYMIHLTLSIIVPYASVSVYTIIGNLQMFFVNDCQARWQSFKMMPHKQQAEDGEGLYEETRKWNHR